MVDPECCGPTTHEASLLNNTDSIGIAVTMHGYIDSLSAGKATFKDDVDEDKATTGNDCFFLQNCKREMS